MGKRSMKKFGHLPAVLEPNNLGSVWNVLAPATWNLKTQALRISFLKGCFVPK